MKKQTSNPDNCPQWGCWVRVALVLGAWVLLGAGQVLAQKPKDRVPSQADLAWEQLSNWRTPPLPPDEWKSKAPAPVDVELLRKTHRAWAVEWSEAAADFHSRFADHPMSQAARMMELSARGWLAR